MRYLLGVNIASNGYHTINSQLSIKYVLLHCNNRITKKKTEI